MIEGGHLTGGPPRNWQQPNAERFIKLERYGCDIKHY